MLALASQEPGVQPSSPITAPEDPGALRDGKGLWSSMRLCVRNLHRDPEDSVLCRVWGAEAARAAEVRPHEGQPESRPHHPAVGLPPALACLGSRTRQPAAVFVPGQPWLPVPTGQPRSAALKSSRDAVTCISGVTTARLRVLGNTGQPRSAQARLCLLLMRVTQHPRGARYRVMLAGEGSAEKLGQRPPAVPTPWL